MTKQKILDNALALFMEKGYEGASMSDIAAATGIRKASLYAHFDRKQDIFQAIFDDILAEYAAFIRALTEARAGENALAQLERMFQDFILYCHENMKMYFWDRYFYFPPDFMAETMQRQTQETQTLFLDGIAECMRRGMEGGSLRRQNAADAALAYYYLMIGISMSVKLYDRETLLHDTRAAWGGLRRGLAAEQDANKENE